MKCPSLETIAAWSLAELPAADRDDFEEHFFECDACAKNAEGMAALVRHLGDTLPVFLTAERRERLMAGGAPVTVVALSPGERATLSFRGGPDLGLWLMRADLSGVSRVDCEMLAADGTRLTDFLDVPFDGQRGELVLGCQRHYRDLPFPAELHVKLTAVEGAERRTLGEYVLDHVFDSV